MDNQVRKLEQLLIREPHNMEARQRLYSYYLTLGLINKIPCRECQDTGWVWAGCYHCDDGAVHSKCDSYYHVCSKVVTTYHIAKQHSDGNVPYCDYRQDHTIHTVHEHNPVMNWVARNLYLRNPKICKVCKARLCNNSKIKEVVNG